MKKRFNVFFQAGLQLVVAVLLVYSFNSCNDDPTIAGHSLIYDTVNIASLTSYDSDAKIITGTESYYHYVKNFNYGEMLLGSYNGLKSAAFMRFESFPDSLTKETQFISAKLKIAPRRYVFGDSLANRLSFNIYQMTERWEDTTDRYTFFGGCNFTPEASGHIDGSKILASYDGVIPLESWSEDTETYYIEMDFDETLVKESLEKQIDYRAGDSSDYNVDWGIALLPNESECTVLRQFISTYSGNDSISPQMEIVFLNGDNEPETLTLYSAIVHTVACGPEPEEGYITLQGNVSYRTEIKFDLSMIPKYAAIHKADLRLTRNSALCEYGNSVTEDSIFAQILEENDRDGEKMADYLGVLSDTTKDEFMFRNIVSAVELWAREDKKGSIFFRALGKNNEYDQIDKLVFHGIDDPDESKRPRLRVIYSTRPEMKK